MAIKRALQVVNYGNFMCQNVRESFQHAANRWGADYVEVTETTVFDAYPGHPAGKKPNMFHQCPDADEVLSIDADAIISAAAPSPFEARQKDSLFVVTCNNPAFGELQAILAGERYEWGKMCAKWGHIPGPPPLYFNSGMVLAARDIHYNYLEEVRQWVQVDLGLGWIDQTPFVYGAEKHKLKIQYADATWNFMHAECLLPGFMNMRATGKFIYHFAGTIGREGYLPRINWK